MKKKWFVGIDVSKLTLDIALYTAKSKMTASDHIQVKNTVSGFQEFLDWLKERGITRSGCVVGMEHTGIYSLDISLFLENKRFDYCLFNPIHLKRSLGLVRGKNDRVDAFRIANYCYLHREDLVYSHMASSSMLEIRSLLSERKLYVEQMATHKGFLTESKGRKSSSRGQRCARIVDYLEKQIEEIEKEINDIIDADTTLKKNYELVTSVKGIGFVNAINFLVHTNNFMNFENARQYACYTGIAPFEYSSGTSVRGKTRVNKMGARQVKADLTQAAKSAVQHDPQMTAYYVRKKQEGKSHGSIMNAIKFKLVERVFAVIREQRVYLDAEKFQELKKAV
jgi:transposase